MFQAFELANTKGCTLKSTAPTPKGICITIRFSGRLEAKNIRWNGSKIWTNLKISESQQAVCCGRVGCKNGKKNFWFCWLDGEPLTELLARGGFYCSEYCAMVQY